MRVISWNMGMATRPFQKPGLHDQAWYYLLGLGPDLALLQEALPPPWVRTEGVLVQGPVRSFGSAIFSPRYPLERLAISDEALRMLGSYLAYATVELPDGQDAVVVSVHTVDEPVKSDQLGSHAVSDIGRGEPPKAWTSDLAFAGLAPMVRGRRFIVGGDWNTALRFGPVNQTTELAAAFFTRASEEGWVECVPPNPGEEMCTRFHAGLPESQIDHVFVDQGLSPRFRSARVATDAVLELGLSDHAPLIVDLAMEAIAQTSRGLQRQQERKG